jgi:hypothetical protein
MATVLDLVDSIKGQLRDSDLVEVTITQLQGFINDAAQDAKNSGWLIVLEDDESLTWTANTYAYSVPASFAYVSELRVENTATSPSTWDEVVPDHFWEIRLDSSVPKFFISRGFPIPNAKLMKVIGQERPTIYSSGATGLAETVDLGFESFLRDRALALALGFQATANPTLEIDRTRIALMDRAMGRSEAMLARHPQENRVNPSAVYVPSR